ncbi:hypothetical protein [Microbispora rosea]
MTAPRWTPERLSTTARMESCPRCHALTIRALDSPVAGLDVRLDPIPLDLVGEIQARLEGRATYDLIGTLKKEIAYRNQWRIKKRKYPILPTHKCPGPVSTKALFLNRPPTRKATDERPPF